MLIKDEDSAEQGVRGDEEKVRLEKLPIRVTLNFTDKEKQELKALLAWEEASSAGMAHYVLGKGWRNPQEKMMDEIAYKQKYDEFMGRR